MSKDKCLCFLCSKLWQCIYLQILIWIRLHKLCINSIHHLPQYCKSLQRWQQEENFRNVEFVLKNIFLEIINYQYSYRLSYLFRKFRLFFMNINEFNASKINIYTYIYTLNMKLYKSSSQFKTVYILWHWLLKIQTYLNSRN